MLAALATTPAIPDAADEASPRARAEVARWLLHECRWGYISEFADAAPPAAGRHVSGGVFSFSDGNVDSPVPAEQSTGRLFFYIMGGVGQSFNATLTVSEAALANGTCGFAGTFLDPEDPRCAKLSALGTMTPSAGASAATGLAALYSRHPQMRAWPTSHRFVVHELLLRDVWLLDGYGGGVSLQLDDYFSAEPRDSRHGSRHARLAPAAQHSAAPAAWPAPAATGAWIVTQAQLTRTLLPIDASPAATKTGAPMLGAAGAPGATPCQRARWLAYHSTWSALTTRSVARGGAPWGNVRSVADGLGSNSTGRLFLYLPTPDPSAADIRADPRCALTLSAAALPPALGAAGGRAEGWGLASVEAAGGGAAWALGGGATGACGASDPQDPTCAHLTLTGTLREQTSSAQLQRATASLGARHPLAPWLAAGGAHTGGGYFELEIDEVWLLDHYGGPTRISAAEYTQCARLPPMVQR